MDITRWRGVQVAGASGGCGRVAGAGGGEWRVQEAGTFATSEAESLPVPPLASATRRVGGKGI